MERTTELSALSNDLATYAARLVRLIRQNIPQAVGVRTMSILDQYGPAGVTTLAQLDNCSQPTMTGTVRQLIAEGWVTKTPNPADARGSLIALTDAGRAELARVRAGNAELIASRIVVHPERTLADLATTVAVLRDVLTEPTESTESTEPTTEPEELNP